MAGNLVNCTRCRRVFVQAGGSGKCLQCLKEIEEEFLRCATYLRQNPACTMTELSDGAEVDVKQIVRFIQEGRLIVEKGSRIEYPCSVCGVPIRAGKYCAACQKELAADIRGALPDKKSPEAAGAANKGYAVTWRRNGSR